MHHSLSLFERDPDLNSWSSEVSILTGGGRKPLFRQIFPDSADEGFTIVSHETGRVAEFVVHAEQRNRDGEVMVWELRATPKSAREHPRLRGAVFFVFNT